MSLHTEQRADGSNAPRRSSSPEPVEHSGNKSHHGQPSTSQPSQPYKQSPSIHFDNSIAEDRSSLSQSRPSADADEITPIKQVSDRQSRKYNTTEPEESSRRQNSAKPASSRNTDQYEAEQTVSWWKRIADKYGSVSLDNKGSVARDHLALERTFLAWLRTSLAFASIGIAVTQLFRLNTSLQRKSEAVTYHTPMPSLLPLSPLIGHGLPPELIPLLQQLASATAQALPTSVSRNTLLDQLLLMPVSPTTLDIPFRQQAFDERSATKLRRVGKPLGATFIGISIVILLVGFHRYFEAQYWIIRGKFPASRGSVAFTGVIAGALIIASLIVVLVVAPVSYEK